MADFFSSILNWVPAFFTSLVSFLVIFSVLVVIHEFGHFFAAIKSGVKVEEFGLGLGKRLFTHTRKGVDFTINLIPFGGFVRMLGESETSKDPRSFEQAPLYKRMIITLAGVFMNFVLTIVILAALFMVGTSPFILTQEEQDAAIESGVIMLEKNEAEEVIGYEIKDVQLAPHKAIAFAFTETARMSGVILDKLAEIPRTIINEKRLPDGLSGPVGIAQISGTVVSNFGIEGALRLMAQLSLSLAIMNLLPIPALDGGRFLFQVIEMFSLLIFKKRPSPKIENYVHVIGFALILGLMLLITVADVGRIFGT
jgi:regulator of sigma E protease